MAPADRDFPDPRDKQKESPHSPSSFPVSYIHQAKSLSSCYILGLTLGTKNKGRNKSFSPRELTEGEGSPFARSYFHTLKIKSVIGRVVKAQGPVRLQSETGLMRDDI